MAEFLEHKYEKFIFRAKAGYFYSQEEFWADIQGNVATVGLTDFLQKAKGDVAFLETVEPGFEVKRGQEIGKIETIKATFSIISPVSGKVAEVNPEMDASPYLINHDPYGAGWIYRIELSDPEGDKAQLMGAEEYFEAMKNKIAREAKKLYG
ncbi:MAG: glycine cleavage system protein H [Desulfobaccales bacterium]